MQEPLQGTMCAAHAVPRPIKWSHILWPLFNYAVIGLNDPSDCASQSVFSQDPHLSVVIYSQSTIGHLRSHIAI